MTDDASLLAPAIFIAAIVIRTALLELRHPGNARQQWATLAGDGKALAAGGTTGVATVLLGWGMAGPAALAWAVLTGALTAHLVHQSTPRR
ncbi:hypothetical protein ABZT08_03235 [Streptomyces sp. NPDC005526]|uniref:hypothetical protein n=1 Tax=Streptomyces sp. NPDC005526 TaxID=3156885 RepID=UPI0033A0044D